MKQQLTLVTLLFANTLNASELCNSFSSLGGHQDARYSAAEILKSTQLSTLESSPNNYCNSNMLRRYLEANTEDKQSIRKLSDSQVLQKAEELAAREDSSGGGFLSLPILKHKEATTKNGILLVSDGLFLDHADRPMNEILNEAQNIINSDPCIHQERQGQDLSSLVREKGVLPESADSLFMKAATAVGPPVVCGEIAPLTQVLKCGRSMSRMIQKMAQKGVPPLTSMPDVLDKIINSGEYDEGLKIAANKIIAQARNPEKAGSNLYSDVKSSFREAGYSEAVAEQMTFDTLGMIATGGAGMAIRLNKIGFGGDRWPSVTALTTIAALTPYLDFFTAKNGTAYSFPPGVKAECDTSKSYHFWMSAYLAREAVNEGASPEAAAAAAYSVAKAYHVMGNLTNRSGAAPLLMQDAFSPATNIVRADLSYAGAGALYGSGADSSAKNIDIDAGIGESIHSSAVSPALSKEEAISTVSALNIFGYSEFKENFAPNEVFRSLKDGRNFKTIQKASIKTGAPASAKPKIKCNK